MSGPKSRRQILANTGGLLAGLFAFKPGHAAIKPDLPWEIAPLQRLKRACAGYASMDIQAAVLCDIAKKRANDFRHGRVCVVDGWLLSKTEARFYASLPTSR